MNKVAILFCWLLSCTVHFRAAAQSAVASLAEKGRIFNASHKYDSALLYADSALALNKDFRQRQAGFKAMRIKGRALFGLKQEKKAIDLYFSTLAQCTQPGDSAEKAHILGEIGYLYFAQARYAESKSYYKKEIALLSTLKGRDSTANQLINMAVMHQSLGEIDSARLMLKEVHDIVSHTGDSAATGYYLFNMGALCTAMQKPDSAKVFYLRALDIWKALNNNTQLFRVTFNIGFYYYQKKNYAEAVRYYRLSEAAALKYGNKKDVAHVYGTMAEAYAEMGNYKDAYTSIYKYATLNDSFYREDINNYILELDTRYQAAQHREKIQAQELLLRAASLAVQQQKNTVLIVILILVVALAVGGAAFGRLTFRARVQKEVDEAKNKFFANVAHEIRTPLSMIHAPLQAAREKTSDATLHRQLDLASRNATRLNELINQMLDISKLDAAQYTLHPTLGSFAEFINGLSAPYIEQAKEKQITLHVACDEDTPHSLFDRDAMEKIIGNLLGNAIKYTPAGGTAGIDCTVNNNGKAATLKVTVWDSGPGIPASQHQLIFDRFYRSETASDSAKGVGIGLSLVRDLVHIMNGTIEVTSDAGKGATFIVTCPLMLPTTASGNTSTPQTHLASLLLVEDDADILAFNKEQLEGEGYNVWTATNGIEAQELLQGNLPDIIVTDLMMPRSDGMALLKEVRANAAWSHIPVIILSAKASLPARVEGLAGGAQGYLAKPFSPAELKALIRNQLSVLASQKTRYQSATADTTMPLPDRFAGTDPFTRQFYELLHQHMDDASLSVERLAELMHINRSHFQRKVKALTGYSPSELIRTIRLERARELLLKKEGNITEIAYATGFTSQSYFTKCFSEHFGYPPSQAASKT